MRGCRRAIRRHVRLWRRSSPLRSMRWRLPAFVPFEAGIFGAKENPPQSAGFSLRESAPVVHGLQRLHQDAKINVTELAMELEYFDQAHFIRDFRKLVGCSPARVVVEAAAAD